MSPGNLLEIWLVGIVVTLHYLQSQAINAPWLVPSYTALLNNLPGVVVWKLNAKSQTGNCESQML